MTDTSQGGAACVCSIEAKAEMKADDCPAS